MDLISFPEKWLFPKSSILTLSLSHRYQMQPGGRDMLLPEVERYWSPSQSGGSLGVFGVWPIKIDAHQMKSHKKKMWMLEGSEKLIKVQKGVSLRDLWTWYTKICIERGENTYFCSMCVCFHTQYLLTGSISIRTETPKVKKNISHRECSTEYMAVGPSTFATSVSWRELQMTETETWQTFQKNKQKKLSTVCITIHKVLRSPDLCMALLLDGLGGEDVCLPSCMFWGKCGGTLRIESTLPQQKKIPEKRVPGKQRFWVTISHEHPSSASKIPTFVPCFGGDQDEDCRIDGLGSCGCTKKAR